MCVCVCVYLVPITSKVLVAWDSLFQIFFGGDSNGDIFVVRLESSAVNTSSVRMGHLELFLSNGYNSKSRSVPHTRT